MYGNTIGEDGAASVSSALVLLINLTTLDLNLQHNSVGDDGAISISLAMAHLTNLTSLNLNLS